MKRHSSRKRHRDGKIFIKMVKNKRHGLVFRKVLMAPLLENLLIEWGEQAKDREMLVFPGMKKHTHLGTMVETIMVRSGASP